MHDVCAVALARTYVLTERPEQELDGLALVPHDRRPDLHDFPALGELQLGEVPEHGLDLLSQ